MLVVVCFSFCWRYFMYCRFQFSSFGVVIMFTKAIAFARILHISLRTSGLTWLLLSVSLKVAVTALDSSSRLLESIPSSIPSSFPATSPSYPTMIPTLMPSNRHTPLLSMTFTFVLTHLNTDFFSSDDADANKQRLTHASEEMVCSSLGIPTLRRQDGSKSEDAVVGCFCDRSHFLQAVSYDPINNQYQLLPQARRLSSASNREPLYFVSDGKIEEELEREMIEVEGDAANDYYYYQLQPSSTTLESSTEPSLEPSAEPSVESSEEPTAEPSEEPSMELIPEPPSLPPLSTAYGGNYGDDDDISFPMNYYSERGDDNVMIRILSLLVAVNVTVNTIDFTSTADDNYFYLKLMMVERHSKERTRTDRSQALSDDDGAVIGDIATDPNIDYNDPIALTYYQVNTILTTLPESSKSWKNTFYPSLIGNIYGGHYFDSSTSFELPKVKIRKITPVWPILDLPPNTDDHTGDGSARRPINTVSPSLSSTMSPTSSGTKRYAGESFNEQETIWLSVSVVMLLLAPIIVSSCWMHWKDCLKWCSDCEEMERDMISMYHCLKYTITRCLRRIFRCGRTRSYRGIRLNRGGISQVYVVPMNSPETSVAHAQNVEIEPTERIFTDVEASQHAGVVTVV